MYRRTFLSLLPALLALVFLCGTPVTSIGGPDAGATSREATSRDAGWNGSRPSPIVRGSLTQDTDDVSVNQSADQDDTSDDRVVRVVSLVVWPDTAPDTQFLHASDRAGLSHQPRAASPRAPPTA
jgi:hypothetical protein